MEGGIYFVLVLIECMWKDKATESYICVSGCVVSKNAVSHGRETGLESAYLDSTIGSIQSVLQRQTEGRVPVFSHEVVPDHLRTKPDPEVEEQEKQLTTDAARIGADAAQVGLSHCPAAPSPSLHKKQDFTKPG